jgi:hypothetical protein
MTQREGGQDTSRQWALRARRECARQVSRLQVLGIPETSCSEKGCLRSRLLRNGALLGCKLWVLAGRARGRDVGKWRPGWGSPWVGLKGVPGGCGGDLGRFKQDERIECRNGMNQNEMGRDTRKRTFRLGRVRGLWEILWDWITIE